MIVIGGFDVANIWSPDPWVEGVAVFDMTALLWKEKFEASAEPYVAPEIVKQFYNQS